MAGSDTRSEPLFSFGDTFKPPREDGTFTYAQVYLEEGERERVLTPLRALLKVGENKTVAGIVEQMLENPQAPEVREYQLIFRERNRMRIALQKMAETGLAGVLTEIAARGGNGIGYTVQQTLHDRARTLTDKGLPGEEGNLYHTARDAGFIADALAREGKIQLDSESRKWLLLAAYLSDVGKHGFTEEQRMDNRGYTNGNNPIRPHPIVGFGALQYLFGFPRAGLLRGISLVALLHHERRDGDSGGYPFGLYGELIPMAVEIIKAPDAFYAMVMRHDLKGLIDPERAIAELERCAGTQFHEIVIEVYTPMLREKMGELQKLYQGALRRPPAPTQSATLSS